MANLTEIVSALFAPASMAIAIALAAITWHYSRFLKDSPYLKTWRILCLVSVVLGSVIILDIIGVQETGVRASILLVALAGFSYVCYRMVPAMQKHVARTLF